MDRLPQHVRAIGPHESSHLDAIHHRIEASYGLTTLQIAEVRGHVAGWEDVGKKQHLFVAEAFGDLDRSNVRIRYAQIFGLSAGEPSQHMRIAEQARWRMSP